MTEPDFSPQYSLRTGCDLVFVPRFAEKRQKHGQRLLDRILTAKEQSLCKGDFFSEAGFWAAKEAFSKAMGTGILTEKSLPLLTIEIQKTEQGKPYVAVSEPIQDGDGVFWKVLSSDLSISHDGEYALATCFILLEPWEQKGKAGNTASLEGERNL